MVPTTLSSFTNIQWLYIFAIFPTRDVTSSLDAWTNLSIVMAWDVDVFRLLGRHR